MKPKRYEPQVKAAIIAAVHEARKSGQKWTDALEAAKKAGYKGTEGGLVQFVRPDSAPKKAKAAKPAKAKATPTVTATAVTPTPVDAPSEAPTVKLAAVKSPAVKPATKPAAVKPVAKRITKSTTTKTSVEAPAAIQTSGPLDITALVHKAVTEAVVNALESLVASIKGGK